MDAPRLAIQVEAHAIVHGLYQRSLHLAPSAAHSKVLAPCLPGKLSATAADRLADSRGRCFASSRHCFPSLRHLGRSCSKCVSRLQRGPTKTWRKKIPKTHTLLQGPKPIQRNSDVHSQKASRKTLCNLENLKNTFWSELSNKILRTEPPGNSHP